MACDGSIGCYLPSCILFIIYMHLHAYIYLYIPKMFAYIILYKMHMDELSICVPIGQQFLLPIVI